ncbi:MAG: 50S ribosomal protein L18 [Chloroflexi bacterium]|nr:50S ribosomal protein L18 [Chloroflexota bacterium]
MATVRYGSGVRKARTTKAKRLVRHIRLRKKVTGGDDRPRLAVFRSLKHIYAQVIDDGRGVTLVAACSREVSEKKKKTEVAKLVGALLARRAGAAGVGSVVFDRGGYKYHGRVKALAEGAREGGLNF